MANTLQDLGTGQLASSEGTLYTTPEATQTLVNSITLVNTDSSARTVNLGARKDGTNTRWFLPVDLSIAAGESFVWDTVITLEADDLIRGYASVATQIDYIINGVEQD